MIFGSIESLREAGFTGFVSVGELKKPRCQIVPEERGVYIFFRESLTLPIFLPIGTGGRSRRGDPNVEIGILKNNWVLNAHEIYIGKAGGSTEKTTLRKRLSTYMSFGRGKRVSHWGGRYLWQLADADQLLVAWKPILDGEPSVVESDLIA